VHAALVLLDRDFALRTRLCVKLEPDLCVIFCLVNTLEPFDKVFARKRSVGLLEATEAPIGFALLTVDISLGVGSALVGKRAIRPGAPFRPLAYVDETLAIVVAILFHLLRSECHLEHGLGDDQLARRLGAGRQDALGTVFELSAQVFAVAVFAQLVPTLQGHGVFLFVVATGAEERATLRHLGNAIVLKELLK